MKLPKTSAGASLPQQKSTYPTGKRFLRSFCLDFRSLSISDLYSQNIYNSLQKSQKDCKFQYARFLFNAHALWTGPCPSENFFEKIAKNAKN